MVLSDAHALLGDDWAGIAARLPGKTADDVRLYFQANPSDDGDWRWDKVVLDLSLDLTIIFLYFPAAVPPCTRRGHSAGPLVILIGACNPNAIPASRL